MTRSHSPFSPTSLSFIAEDAENAAQNPDQWDRLHSLARTEANRLRQEAIDTFWRDVAHQLRRIIGIGQPISRRDVNPGNTLRTSGSL
jgi:hypothetical protein